MENTASRLAHMGGVATSPYRTRSVTAATAAAMFPSQAFERAHSFAAEYGIGDVAASRDCYDDMPPLMEAAAGSYAATASGVASLPLTDSTYTSDDDDDCDDEPQARPTINLRKRKAVDALEDDDTPVAGLKSDPDEPADCCICMCEPEKEEAAVVNGCEHVFCFGCIEKWAERENTCPLCKNRFTNIERLCGGPKKKVKTRDQRADMGPGNALESLLAGMASQHAFPPHLARLFLAGLPSDSNGPAATARSQRVEIGSRAYRVSTRVTTRSTTTTAAPSNDAADDDVDFLVGTRDDEGYRHFAQRVRNMSRQHGLFGAYPVAIAATTTSARRGAPIAIATSIPSRRERVRRDVRTRETRSMVYAAIQRSFLSPTRAGGRPENAIEIMSDSDEEVEVLEVNHAPRRSLR